METITTFITALVALSLAVERVIEVLKGYWPWLREDVASVGGGSRAERRECRRRATLQILSTATGALFAAATGPEHFMPFFPTTGWSSPERWLESLLLGLIASGGSGLWNHLLDIVESTKKLKETAVKTEVAAARAPLAMATARDPAVTRTTQLPAHAASPIGP